MAGDDPLRAIGFLVVDRDAKLVDGEWKGGARHVGRDDRLDAVRLEKPAHDVGFDLRRRPEDDGQAGHERRITQGHTAIRLAASNARSTLSRIIVMSSC